MLYIAKAATLMTPLTATLELRAQLTLTHYLKLEILISTKPPLNLKLIYYVELVTCIFNSCMLFT